MLDIIKDSSVFQYILNSSYKEFGGAFIFGFSIGYFLKKSFKLFIVLLILVTIVSFWLDNKIVKLDSSITLNSFATIIDIFTLFIEYILDKVSTLSNIGIVSIFAGFLIGLKVG